MPGGSTGSRITQRYPGNNVSKCEFHPYARQALLGEADAATFKHRLVAKADLYRASGRPRNAQRRTKPNILVEAALVTALVDSRGTVIEPWHFLFQLMTLEFQGPVRRSPNRIIFSMCMRKRPSRAVG